MKHIYLKPINLRKKEIKKIYDSIKLFLKESLYNNITEIYKEHYKKSVYNTKQSILQLFKNEKLIVKNNVIYGDFNSYISKELRDLGLTYDKNKKGFVGIIPNDILKICEELKIKNKRFIYDLDDYLNTYLQNLESSIDTINIDYSPMIEDYKEQLINSFERFNIKSSFLTTDINNNYINNSKLFIKNMLFEETTKMRNELRELVEQGASNKSISQYLQDNYKMTQKRSLFIARQESSLLLSEYSKQQYLNNGIKKYIWSTSNDERVRKLHRELNNTIQEFDNPPIDDTNGKRHNPGENFNCRCVAIPILE